MTTIVRLLAMALLFMGLVACSKVTAENYGKLEPGMTYTEVERILGTPTRCSDILTARNCTWGDDKRFINISFVGGNVVLYTSQNIR